MVDGYKTVPKKMAEAAMEPRKEQGLLIEGMMHQS